jgi:hypothetical protein
MTDNIVRRLLGRDRVFAVHRNPDNTYHVLCADENGGFIFADKFNSQEEAEWTCGLFNAAIGADTNTKAALPLAGWP